MSSTAIHTSSVCRPKTQRGACRLMTLPLGAPCLPRGRRRAAQPASRSHRRSLTSSAPDRRARAPPRARARGERGRTGAPPGARRGRRDRSGRTSRSARHGRSRRCRRPVPHERETGRKRGRAGCAARAQPPEACGFEEDSGIGLGELPSDILRGKHAAGADREARALEQARSEWSHAVARSGPMSRSSTRSSGRPRPRRSMALHTTSSRRRSSRGVRT